MTDTMDRVRGANRGPDAAQRRLTELGEHHDGSDDPVIAHVVGSLAAAIADRDRSTRTLAVCEEALAKARAELDQRQRRLEILLDTADQLLSAGTYHGTEPGASVATAAWRPARSAIGELPSESGDAGERARPDDRGRRGQSAGRPGRASDDEHDNEHGRVADNGIEVRFLGGFALVVDGVEVDDWRGTRSEILAQYLVHHRARPVDGEVIIEALWPELHFHVGRKRVHQVVYQLRQALKAVGLGAESITCRHGAYQFTPDRPVRVDAEDFVLLTDEAYAHDRRGDSAQAIDAFETALQCYRGDFLTGALALDWACDEQHGLRLRYLRAGIRLAELFLADADAERSGPETGEASPKLHRAIEICAELTPIEPWNERIARTSMRALSRSGNRCEAIAVFRRCAQHLRDELGLEPTAETRDLYDAIVGLDA